MSTFAAIYRNPVLSIGDECLADAYAMGLAGLPLSGIPLFKAREWHLVRNERPGYLSEGCDNPVVDWFCQGHREFDAERGTDTVALTVEPHVERGQWFTVVGMLWNLADRADLTNETGVRALLEGPRLALEAPKTADDLLKP